MRILYTVLFFIFFPFGFSYAEEIHLDIDSIEKPQYEATLYKFEQTKRYTPIKENDFHKHSHKHMKKLFNDDYYYYKAKTISNKKEKKIGKIKLGTKSDITLNPNKASSTKTLYSDYALSKRLSIGGSYNAKALEDYKTLQKGAVSGEIEYKLTKKTSLKNIYSKNLNDRSNKAELQLKYQPLSDDRLDINIGAGQKSFGNGRPFNSQLNLGTNIRF